MLKKNLVKTSFLSHGLLLFMPHIGSIKEQRIENAFIKLNNSKSKGSKGIADTLIIGLDSSGYGITKHFPEKETASMPAIALNTHASKFVEGYLKRESEALNKVSRRSSYYFTLIDSVLSKHGLPIELKYLAVIESDLKPTAVSKVGAKGMWQLMPVTARELGLKVTKKYDERTHVYKSTVAAARYLKDLYAMYGDWLLTLAAYNGGPGTVNKAIRISGSKNFWALQNYLPAESRGHVKRFIGTHYYFEGQGSITTQTKAEAIAHKKAMVDYIASLHKEEITTDTNKVIAANPTVK